MTLIKSPHSDLDLSQFKTAKTAPNTRATRPRVNFAQLKQQREDQWEADVSAKKKEYALKYKGISFKKFTTGDKRTLDEIETLTSVLGEYVHRFDGGYNTSGTRLYRAKPFHLKNLRKTLERLECSGAEEPRKAALLQTIKGLKAKKTGQRAEFMEHIREGDRRHGYSNGLY